MIVTCRSARMGALLRASMLAVTLLVVADRSQWSFADNGLAPATTKPAASQPSTAPAGGTPKFRCAQLVYEFPDTWAGDSIEHTWTVRNEGDGVLEIFQAQPTCGCTVASFDAKIAPGGEGKISAVLDTRKLRKEVAKNINVLTNDPMANQVTLQLKGRVNSRIDMQPATGAQLGKAAPTGELTSKVTLTNNTKDPIKIEPGPRLEQSPFSCLIAEIEPGQKYEVTVTADRAKLKDGSNITVLLLKTGLAAEPEFSVPAAVFLPPLVQVTPESLALLSPAPVPIHREFSIIYRGAGQMKITGASANDPDIKVRVEEIAAKSPPPAAPSSEQPCWKLIVDIPQGWSPRRPPDGAPPESQPAPVEITATTDVSQRPAVKIAVRPFARPPTADTLIGKAAPQATLKDNSGQEIKLAAPTGRLTVIVFFASWDPDSKRMLPLIQKAADAYGAKGVDFRLVSLDSMAKPEQVAKALQELGVSLPFAVDSAHAASDKYMANKFPMTFIVGKNGVIEAVTGGCRQDYEQTLNTQLDLLLAGKDHTAFPKTVNAILPAPVTKKP